MHNLKTGKLTRNFFKNNNDGIKSHFLNFSKRLSNFYFSILHFKRNWSEVLLRLVILRHIDLLLGSLTVGSILMLINQQLLISCQT